MQALATNGNNDLYVDGNGNLGLALDLDAVIQGCAQVAQTRLGEMVLFINQGIPYFETVFNGSPNLQQFETALRRAFFTVPNVIEIVNLLVERSGNTLSYRAVIRSTYGTGVVTNG